MTASVESAKTETEVAPSLAASDADVLTPSHSGTPDTTPTTATSQAADTPPRVVVPRRPTPHHLSGTKNGRARTRLAASAPAKRTAAVRVRRGAAAREKGDHRDLRRQERTADPANRRGDPPRASQTGDIAAEVAAAQEPPRAAGDSDGPPRPPPRRQQTRSGTPRTSASPHVDGARRPGRFAQRPSRSRKPVSGHPRGCRADRRRAGAQRRLPRSFNPGPGLCEPRSRAGRETAAGRSGAQPKKRRDATMVRPGLCFFVLFCGLLSYDLRLNEPG